MRIYSLGKPYDGLKVGKMKSSETKFNLTGHRRRWCKVYLAVIYAFTDTKFRDQVIVDDTFLTTRCKRHHTLMTSDPTRCHSRVWIVKRSHLGSFAVGKTYTFIFGRFLTIQLNIWSLPLWQIYLEPSTVCHQPAQRLSYGNGDDSL